MGKPEKDSLGDRMKRYEAVPRVALTRRLPMIVRVDGRAFHTFTRGMLKPWDEKFVEVMQDVAVALCEEIDGACLAYVQSDEISVLVRDDQTLQTEPWFDKDLQKITSVSASIAAARFTWAYGRLATFDSRAFVLPPAEVCNYFVWRQQDAVRNSIQGLGQAHFSHEELQGLKCEQIQEKLFRERGINWNDVPTHLKRGACVRLVRRLIDRVYTLDSAAAGKPPITLSRFAWEVDLEIPTFTQDREYVEHHLDQEDGESEQT